MLWLFRDMNNVRQIENSRKDVNLKEFQKIAEWASGQHLPEIKKTKKSAADNREESTIEMTHPPEGEIAISRWQGATALQISAIEQLGSYLRGDHGTELQKPAFLLLKQLWANLVTSALKEMSLEHPPLFAGNTALAQKTQSPLGQTLNRVLLQHHEIWCERFPEELLGIVLAGFENTLTPLTFTLKNKSLQHANFIGAILSKADFSKANLSGANLTGANLRRTNLSGAKLSEVTFSRTDLSRANLTGANLSRTDLSEAKFNEATLDGATLDGADLNKAYLMKAHLNKANLSGADLNRANLSGANLSGANLTGANLSRTDLSRANLTGTNLSRTDLSRANLNGADLRHCYFDAHTTWQAAEHLDTVMLCSSENPTDFPVLREYLCAQATGQRVEISTEIVNYLYQHQPDHRIFSTKEEIKQSFGEIRKNHT